MSPGTLSSMYHFQDTVWLDWQHAQPANSDSSVWFRRNKDKSMERIPSGWRTLYITVLSSALSKA